MMRVGNLNLSVILKWLAVGLTALVLAACEPITQPDPVEPEPEPGANVFDPNGPVRVALLVPRGSGDSDRDALAQSLINAARLATSDSSGVQIDLAVYDTAGDPGQAVIAASQAITDGARMIIGPLFSTSVAAVAPIAADANIPILSLSNNVAVAAENVYVLGITFENTASRLVSYGATRGRTQLGVIYTEDAEGFAAREAVRAATVNSAVSLVAEASYVRSRQGIPDAAEGFTQAMRSAGVDSIIMSDRGAGLAFAASFLPFYRLNMDRVQMMGIQRLDSDAIADDGTLGGAWFAAPDPALIEVFDARYQGIYGAPPHVLASLAYDGIAAVSALIREAQLNNVRNGFDTQFITAPAGFAGVNGPFRFSGDGHIERGLAVMEVTRDGPELVDPAPRSFEFTGF